MAVEVRKFLPVMLGVLFLAASPMPPDERPSGQPPQASGGLVCTDDMETEPFNDEYEAQPVADHPDHDGGCRVSQDPIAA